jgi:hypothetical protein
MYAYLRDMYLILSCMQNPLHLGGSSVLLLTILCNIFFQISMFQYLFFPPLAGREFPLGDGELSLRKSFSATKICADKGRSKYFLYFRVVTCGPQWGRSLARSYCSNVPPKLLLSRSPNSSLSRSHRPRSFVVFEFLRSLVACMKLPWVFSMAGWFWEPNY